MWSNHPELTRNGLLLHAEKWFEEVRSGRTTPNSLEPTPLASFPLHDRGLVWSNHPELIRNSPVGLFPLATQWFEEVWCGRTTLNSLETAL